MLETLHPRRRKWSLLVCVALGVAIAVLPRSWQHFDARCFFVAGVALAGAIPRRDAVQGAIMVLEAATSGENPRWPDMQAWASIQENPNYVIDFEEGRGLKRVARPKAKEPIYSFELPLKGEYGVFRDMTARLGVRSPPEVVTFQRIDGSTVSAGPLPAKSRSMAPSGGNLYYRSILGTFSKVNYREKDGVEDLEMKVASAGYGDKVGGHDRKWVRIIRGKEFDVMLVAEGFRYDGQYPTYSEMRTIMETFKLGP